MAISVRIAGSSHTLDVMTDGFSVDWTLGGRVTAGFTVHDHITNTYRPVAGNDVKINDGVEDIFGGSIDEVDERNPHSTISIRTFVRCVGYEQRLDRRIDGPVVYGLNFATVNPSTDVITCENNGFQNGYPVQWKSSETLPTPFVEDQTYYVINKSGDTFKVSTSVGGVAVDIGSVGIGEHRVCWMAGGIVKNILSFYSTEAITVGDVQPGALIESVTYVKNRLNEIFDGLANLSEFIWYVKADKTFHFKPRTGNTAPFDIADGSMDVLANTLSVRTTREELANRVWVQASDDAIAPAVLLHFVGDGTRRYFFNFAVMDNVTSITVAASEQTFGPRGGDIKQWYWTPGDHWIIQDPGETVVGSGVDIFVSYHGVGFNTVSSEDTSAQSDQAIVEGGGSGIYEALIVDTSLTSLTAAQQAADSELALRKSIPREVSYDTRTRGLLPGQIQTITLTREGISGTYLIQSVSAIVEKTAPPSFRYTVKAISTTRLRDYLDTFKSFVGGSVGGGAAVTGGAATLGMIQINPPT